MFHGTPLAVDLIDLIDLYLIDFFSFSRGPLTQVSTVVPLAIYLGAPPALEAPKALTLERLPAPCSIGS